jgi:hypothetical protein
MWSQQIVPLSPVPSQTLSVVLSGYAPGQIIQQNCIINVYQKGIALYLDLYANGQPVITTKVCRDRVALVMQAYLPFIGDLFFKDMQGQTDPYYTGLGSRYLLCYGPSL